MNYKGKIVYKERNDWLVLTRTLLAGFNAPIDTIGQWNTFHIIMKGDYLTVILNDMLILDNAQLPGVPAQGPIALQHHGDRKDGEWGASYLQFRRIYIKELGALSSH